MHAKLNYKHVLLLDSIAVLLQLVHRNAIPHVRADMAHIDAIAQRAGLCSIFGFGGAQ
jgi:hypothetical protein